MRKSVKGYMCGVDFQHELGEVCDIIIYPTVEDFKKHRTCWPECGIVEVDVTFTKWVEPQDFGNGKSQAKKDET